MNVMHKMSTYKRKLVYLSGQVLFNTISYQTRSYHYAHKGIGDGFFCAFAPYL